MTFDPALIPNVVSVTIAALAFWFSIRSARRSDLDKRFDEVSTKVGANSEDIANLRGRTVKVEQTLENLPSKQEMHNLELGISQMSGDLKALTETIKGHREILNRIDTTVTRHDDHLLEKNR